MIPLFKPNVPFELRNAWPASSWKLFETLRSGWIGEGPRVKEFEKLLAPWVGSEQVLAVNSCTSAIQLALRLAGVGPGDEVITTPMTCTATNMPILAIGAIPVWADIDPRTGNIDLKDAWDKVTEKTRAVIIVDWAGYPAGLTKELGTASNMWLSRARVKVIQDAAHSIGAYYKQQLVGTYADYTCFSFQAIKHLTTGDGGALVCKDKADYERAKRLRWFGIDRDAPSDDMRCEHDIPEWGYKFQMNDIAATLGIAGLKTLGATLGAHRRNAAIYDMAFVALPGITLPSYCNNIDSNISSYWFYPVFVENKHDFMDKMKLAGIQVSQVHKRNDLYSCFGDHAYRNTYPMPIRCALPGVEEFERTHVAIPCGWWLTPEDREHIITTVQAYCHNSIQQEVGAL